MSNEMATVPSILAASEAKLSAALPSHMKAGDFARLALVDIPRDPRLQQACAEAPETVINSLMDAARLGLQPGPALGLAYIVTFRNYHKASDRKRMEAQLIIGYRGLVELARRSGLVRSIEAHAVFSGDVFNVSLGTEGKIDHVPNWAGPRKPDDVIAVYAVCHMKDGGHQFDVMTSEEVDIVKRGSVSGNSNSPWKSHWIEMAKKTVIRRAAKLWPQSPEMVQALALNDTAHGILQPVAIPAPTARVSALANTFQDPAQPEAPAALEAPVVSNAIDASEQARILAMERDEAGQS